MQNSTSKEYGELIALRDARRKATWTPPTKSWWTLEEWIKSWRTPVQKDDEIGMKDERIRLNPCGDLDGGFDEMVEEILNSGKEKMKPLGSRIYSSRTNSEEKGLLTWMK